MKISKEELKNLILEEYKRALNEQDPVSGTIDTSNPGAKKNPFNADQQKQDAKQTLKQNVSQQLKLLRFMRETLKQVKLPQELDAMIKHIQNAKTPDFLTQVLQVEKSIPVNVGAALTNPMGLLQAIIDEVLKSAVRKANQKLAEGKKEFDSILTEEFDPTKELEEAELHFGHDPQTRLEKHKRKELKKHPEEIPPLNLSPEDKEKIKK